MSKKRSFKGQPNPNPSWVETYEIQVNGRNITQGTEVSIRGERGRFRFMKHVKTDTAEWVDVVGGVKGVKMWRSFRVDRVKTVHRKNKIAENLIKERKEAT
jgi:Na+-transporting NADH:ubiquinone oxidoreductase subunit NqrF